MTPVAIGCNVQEGKGTSSDRQGREERKKERGGENEEKDKATNARHKSAISRRGDARLSVAAVEMNHTLPGSDGESARAVAGSSLRNPALEREREANTSEMESDERSRDTWRGEAKRDEARRNETR